LLRTLFFQNTATFTPNISESKEEVPSSLSWTVEITSYVNSLLRAFPAYLSSESSNLPSRDLSHMQVVFSLLIDLLDVDSQVSTILYFIARVINSDSSNNLNNGKSFDNPKNSNNLKNSHNPLCRRASCNNTAWFTCDHSI
jgi:hypothetical protein